MTNDHDLDFDEFDEVHDPRPEDCDFDHVVESAISRRGFLSVVAVGTAGFLTSTALPRGAFAASDRFGFDQVAATTAVLAKNLDLVIFLPASCSLCRLVFLRPKNHLITLLKSSINTKSMAINLAE